MVKPVRLMRHLVRLVTPPGGTVLDPFLGSGTTAIAAIEEGFEWIGIEREEEYVAIAEERIAHWSDPVEPEDDPEPPAAVAEPVEQPVAAGPLAFEW